MNQRVQSPPVGARTSSPVEVVPARVVFESIDRGPVVRVLLLTPRSAQEIVDVVLSDRCARSLTVLLPNDTSDAAMTWVRGQFAWLRRRGISFRVERRTAGDGGRSMWSVSEAGHPAATDAESGQAHQSTASSIDDESDERE